MNCGGHILGLSENVMHTCSWQTLFRTLWKVILVAILALLYLF